MHGTRVIIEFMEENEILTRKKQVCLCPWKPAWNVGKIGLLLFDDATNIRNWAAAAAAAVRARVTLSSSRDRELGALLSLFSWSSRLRFSVRRKKPNLETSISQRKISNVTHSGRFLLVT